MGVRLLPPPRLYRSELGSRDSRRDALLLLELPTEGGGRGGGGENKGVWEKNN